MKSALFLRIAALAVAALLGSAAVAAEAPRASLVETAAVTQGSIAALQNFVGTLYYETKSDVAAEQEGVVSEVHFAAGQNVRRGDVLITLESTILESTIKAKEASLRARQAELTRQERELSRTRALFERRSIAETTYDQVFYGVEQVRAEADVLKNEIAALQTQLQKMQIRSPFDAVITERTAERGEWIAKGAKVATLVAPLSIKARLNVPTHLLGSFKAGQSIEAEVEGARIDARIRAIIPQADTATRTFPLELTLQTETVLIEGMRIDVKLPATEENTHALLVPRDAVVRRFGQNVVFVVRDGKAVMLGVEIVGYRDNMAAVSGQGLAEGMEVIVKGNERVFPNMPVTVMKASS